MSLSLREQLLQAGFGKKKPEQRVQPEREQQRRERQKQAAKAAREQELRQRRQEEADRKARWTQIKALIEQHRLPKTESDDYFNFIHRGKVRRLAVDAPRREQLVRGELFIIRCEGKSDVVTAAVAEQIRALDQRAVVALDANAQAGTAAAGDDPYKDYIVPDDLRW